jgi:hypothetical protein
MVAAALICAQRRQLVTGADRDHRLTGMDPRVLAGPHRPQQSQFVGWPLKLAANQQFHWTGRQPSTTTAALSAS